MSEFDLSVNLNGNRYTARGRSGTRAYPETPAPGEPTLINYQWKIRVVDETNGFVAMYRPMLTANQSTGRAASQTLDAIARGLLDWSRLIPADDPRLQ